ncbi:MAG TPA: hypothetical protein H9895_10890 [Candidatus Pseudogracilibacillus intestinigallinarum]|uniref:Uncharacterized protein n=1 Tax=Candidatus Pseudogracilibacillus intestinigallinarum TaxID=2838742 RepID=A0A9D1PN95_9BACI|nr:hypothetical protein [Candidatus Pseudogracilibacillus intestinigallinarum]
MKQLLKWVVISFAVMMLVSCNITNENEKPNEKNNIEAENAGNNEVLQQENSIIEPKNPDAPLIDTDKSINQREALLNLFEAAKDEPIISILEPGDDYMNINMFNRPLEEKQPISVETSIDVTDVLVQLLQSSVLTEYGIDTFMEEDESEATNIEEFSENGKEGVYYQTDDGVYGMAFEFDGRLYNPFISNVQSTEDKEKMQTLLKLMTKSMNTENEGAYNPIYDHFTIDLNEVKFPSFNEERVEMESIGVLNNPSETPSSRHTNEVRAFYNIEHLTYVFHIRAEQLEIYDEDSKETESLKADNGTEVIKHMSINDDGEVNDTSYEWKDGSYYYVINTSDTEDLLSDDEILTIIDSTIKDKREFDHLNSFQNLDKDFSLSKEEKELAEIIKEFAS